MGLRDLLLVLSLRRLSYRTKRHPPYAERLVSTVTVVYLEAEDRARDPAGLDTSQDPFDQWRAQFQAILEIAPA